MAINLDLFKKWIEDRDDIVISDDNTIKWTSSMYAGAYYGLIGMSLDLISTAIEYTRRKSGRGYMDSIKLLDDPDINWDINKVKS